jgi:hypothetical protein
MLTPDKELTQRAATCKQADNKPVDTAPVKAKRLTHIVDMCRRGYSSEVKYCEYCGAHRFSIGTGKGPHNAKVFTPHKGSCPVPSMIHIIPERLSDYARRKAEFFANCPDVKYY